MMAALEALVDAAAGGFWAGAMLAKAAMASITAGKRRTRGGMFMGMRE
jgi:hypothetical protein